MTRRNPLLAIPPKGIHGLGIAAGRHFERHVGRPTTAEDYHGVHTTGSQEIAGVYAMGAVTQIDNKYDHPDAYPVIIMLDVSGLTALPDVDALAESAFLLKDKTIRRQYEGTDLQEAIDSEEYNCEIGVGDDVNTAVMESMICGRGVTRAFDDDEAWGRWVKTGKYTDEEATQLVDQRRFMNDFGFDRVLRIYAMKQWWPVILEDPWDEEQEEEFERIQSLGYRPVTQEDLMNQQVLDLQVIYDSGRHGAAQYHGTSSWHAQQAFPEIQLPPNPFPAKKIEHSYIGGKFEIKENPKLKAKLLR